MVCEATVSAEVVNVATPEALTATLPASVLAPSLNVTVPAFTVALEVTVAVKVTDWPKVDGLTDEVNAVVVGAAVLTSRHQPPPTDPLSPVASSTTNSCQTPFGF